MSNDLVSSRHCNVCLLLPEERPKQVNGSQKLLKCNGCQLVSYCGPEHQRADWQLHRGFCRAAEIIKTEFSVGHPYLLTGPLKSASDLERATLQVKYLLPETRNRKLEWHEEELTSFPAYCAVCYSLQQLQHCEHCGGVSYCSTEHRMQHAEQHARHCGLLQLYYCPYKLRKWPVTEMFELRRRVPHLQRTDLVGALEYATMLRLPTQPTATPQAYQQFAAAADYSCVATICYALSYMDMQSFKSERFIIYIVGATMEHQLYFQTQHVRFFFLHHPHLTHLQLFFIGPEANEIERRQEFIELGDVRRQVEYRTYRKLLQSFTMECKIKPSLLIAFNCGFSENAHNNNPNSKMATTKDDTWKAGIMEMLSMRDAPIVFTSYSKLEAEFDFATLMRVANDGIKNSPVHVKRIFNVKYNPYRDLRPQRNWQLTSGAGGMDDGLMNEEPIYFRNGYVQAVRAQIIQQDHKEIFTNL